MSAKTLAVGGAIALVLTALVGVDTPATAAAPITGKIVNASSPSEFLADATVRLRTVTEDGPGVVVATVTTGDDGFFSLDAGVTPDDEYYLEVQRPNYRNGYVGGAADEVNYVEFNAEFAATYGPGDALGRVLMVPAFIKGRLVNAATGRPVRNVKVAAGSQFDFVHPEGTDVTDSKGRFYVNGLTCEDDCYLRFKGRPQGYEFGYRACGGTVVATWEEACASPLGSIGNVRIDRL